MKSSSSSIMLTSVTKEPMATPTLQSQPIAPARKPRGSYRKQFERDPALKHVELEFFPERYIEILQELDENRFLSLDLIRALFSPSPVHPFNPHSIHHQ